MSGGIGLAFSIASAGASLMKGQAEASQLMFQAASLESQAKFTRFRAKQESLKHRKEANNQLERILMQMASINAAAGAGNMDPFSGNAFGLKIRALSVGGTNFAMAKGNEDIVRLMGEAQANIQSWQAGMARKAAGTAVKRGMMGAVFTLAKGGYNYYNTAIPSVGGGSSNLFVNNSVLNPGNSFDFLKPDFSTSLGGYLK